MTRARIVDEPEACHHGVPWDDWCPWCEAEDEAICTECSYPLLACVCLPGDGDLFETTPGPDPKQAMAEALLRYGKGRGLEIVRDPLGRVA